jgi:hypothetical protein
MAGMLTLLLLLCLLLVLPQVLVCSWVVCPRRAAG